MPTFISMIEKFLESSYRYKDKRVEKLLLGREIYSLVEQETITCILEKNIIKSTNKEILNLQIAEGIEDSLKNMKRFNDKILGKSIYKEMSDFLDKNYGFNIDLTQVYEIIIGSADERCLYLLRQTERENYRGERKSIAEIAEELGCSRRVLEKDLKKMTEQGFKLLGMNIKLIDEAENILKMESTPHPVILMQNITQIFVLLEGLRAMEKINAFSGYARNTAYSLWNQLTEYAQDKVLDAVEKFIENKNDICWYMDLNEGSKEYSSFKTEIESCEGNPSSQLMYLGKNEKPFNLTYLDDMGNEVTLNDCRVEHYHPSYGKAEIITLDGKYEIDDEKILEIEIV